MTIQKVVNEGTGFPLTNRLLSASGSAVTPTSLKYRVDCETTGREIVGWTDVSPSSEVSMDIDPSWSAILRSTNVTETKTMTWKANDGLSNQVTGTFQWRVKNLQFVS